MLLDSILHNLKTKGSRVSYINSIGSVGFDELYRCTSNIYRFLLDNFDEKLPVVIYGHKQSYVRACMLACSFAGFTYVPVDSHTPKDRVQAILSKLGRYICIGELPFCDKEYISKSRIEQIMYSGKKCEIEKIYLKPNDTYYIIFTSGSTGVPKGVRVSYSNLDSCVKWLSGLCDFENGVIANQGDFSFDLSVADTYLSLYLGLAQLAFDKDKNLSFTEYASVLKRSNVSYGVFTPSFLDTLLVDKSFCEQNLPALKALIICGEKLRISTAKRMLGRFPGLRLINCYGPTEATFAVTSKVVTQDVINSGEIPLGTAKDGVEIHVVDKELVDAPEGQNGEILILGDSVALGYLDDSDKFLDYHGKRGYLSGDIGVYNDGELYFVGRNDTQIKYKGYRIELSDIERNITEIKGVEYAYVHAKKDADGRVIKLIAFVKLSPKADFGECELLAYIKERLPEYMCPLVRVIQNIPLTSNGKADTTAILREAGLL